MIQCDDIRDRLGEYFDQECSADWQSKIAAHLPTCKECQAELALLTHVTEHVFSAPQTPALPFLWTRVHAAIEAEENRRGVSWWAQWRWMARLTAVTALMVGLGSSYLVHKANTPLESVLQGRSVHQRAIQVASTRWANRDQTAMQLVLGDESWAQN